VQTGEEMKVQLASLEKQLLEELATSQGNILDNRALVASLNETKVKSTTVAMSLLESQALQVTSPLNFHVFRHSNCQHNARASKGSLAALLAHG
jgi:dynein heavy chain 2